MTGPTEASQALSNVEFAPHCPIPCDPDCDAVCHSDHDPSHKKEHWPWDCPTADRYDWGHPFVRDAINRLRKERDLARSVAGFSKSLNDRRKWQRDTAIERAEQAEAALVETRAELSESQRWFDALVSADKAKQGAADWMLSRLHNDGKIDRDTYDLLCRLLRDQANAKRCLLYPETWESLTDRLRRALAELAEFEHEVEWAHRVVSVDGTWAGDEVIQADERAAHVSAGIVARMTDPATDRVDVVCRDVWTRTTDWRKADD